MTRDPIRVQTYVERLRKQSRRYAEQLFHDMETVRAMAVSLEKERDFLLERTNKLQHEVEETDRVRAECVRLQGEQARLNDELRRANDLIEFYMKERGELRVRMSEIEAESTRYATQYLDVEQQNTNLANLYVAIHRLHGSLERTDVLEGIKEIIINLVGSEELAVFECDGDDLRLIASFGLDEQQWATVPAGAGWIGRAVRDNEIFVRDDAEASPLAHEHHLTACVPLRVNDQVTGAIAVFRLLEQKPALESIDRELFELLAMHGGTALYTTNMYALHETPLVATEAVS